MRTSKIETESWNPFKHGITKSIIEVFRQCPEKARLRYVEMLDAPIKSEAIDFGNYCHEIIEYAYSSYGRGYDLKQSCNAKMDEIYQREFALISEGNPDTSKYQDLEVTFAKLKAVMPTYFEVWKKNTSKYKWIALEQEFKFKLYGVPIVGKIDGVYEYKDDIYIFETKSKGLINEDLIGSMLSFDTQVYIYYLAVKNLYGKSPKGLNYNVIRRPAHSPLKNEDIRAFQERLTKAVRLTPEHFFIQFHHTFLKEDIKRFKTELEITVEEITERYENDLYYRNSASCNLYNRVCPYFTACATGNLSKLKKRDKIFSELELV